MRSTHSNMDIRWSTIRSIVVQERINSNRVSATRSIVVWGDNFVIEQQDPMIRILKLEKQRSDDDDSHHRNSKKVRATRSIFIWWREMTIQNMKNDDDDWCASGGRFWTARLEAIALRKKETNNEESGAAASEGWNDFVLGARFASRRRVRAKSTSGGTSRFPA